MRPTTRIQMSLVMLALALAAGVLPPGISGSTTQTAAFDHGYDTYGRLLYAHVKGNRVDYQGLVANRRALAEVAARFGAVATGDERAWSRHQRLAFWINAYNLFTLHAISDHYPIRSRWSSPGPKNSIRQIAGVWDRVTWQVAGRQVTLDDIEHRIIRAEFKEPRIHFAVNCASIGCPPLRGEPYRADTLRAQLDENARAYLASPQGLRVDGRALVVTSILKWYGDDFVAEFGLPDRAGRTSVDDAILNVVASYGPPTAAALAKEPGVRIRFMDYDWSLNDIVR